MTGVGGVSGPDTSTEDRRLAAALDLEAEILRKRALAIDGTTPAGALAIRVLADAASHLRDASVAMAAGSAAAVLAQERALLSWAPVSVGQARVPEPGPYRTFGAALRAWQEFHGLSLAGFSRMVRVDEATLKAWSTRTNVPAQFEWTELWSRIASGQYLIPEPIRDALVTLFPPARR